MDKAVFERSISWRYPISFANKFGNEFLFVGSTSVIDVINIHSGKIIHVFEIHQSKIQSMNYISANNNQLFVLAEETAIVDDIQKKTTSEDATMVTSISFD